MEVLLFVGLAVIAITALVKASHLRRDLDDLKRRFTDFAELSDEDRYRRSAAKPEIAERSIEKPAAVDLPAFTAAPLPARAEYAPPAPAPEPAVFESDYLGNLGRATAPELPAAPPLASVPETPVAPSPPEQAVSPVLARIRAAAEASPETQSAPEVSAEVSGGVPPAPPPPELSDAAPEIDRPIALEERLGSRVFVWLGGIALALAGGFLVKYSIEQGWLGPATRCLLGAIFAVALLGAGEWMRSRSNRIAQSLTAAGVATLYAVLFVAVKPYELIPTAVGFSLLAVLTAGAIALALRQGPFVGLLGLAGGFLTPAIVSTGEPNAPVLFVYLLALQLGSQLLARRRGWWWTSALSVAGGLCWTLLWLGDVPRDWSQDAWLGGFLLATAAATLWSRRGPDGNRELTHWDGGRFTALGAQVGVLLVSVILLHASGFGALGWMFFGMLAAIHLGAARLHLENEPVAALSLLAALLLLIVWPGDVQQMVYDSQTDLTTLVSSNPGFQNLLITELLSLGALYTIGAFAGLWGARLPLHWALYSVLASAGFFLVGYLRLNEVAGLPSWGLMSLIVAAFHALAAGFVLQQRAKRPDYNDALGAYALGVSGFVAFAVPLELKQSWMAVGWALLLPAMAWIEARLNIRWLRGAAAVIAALVLLRLLPGPWILEFPTGSTPILNWILYGYGIPLLAFGAAAWQFRRTADGGLVQLLEGGAILIGFLLVTLEIHHYFQGSLRFAMDVNLVQVTGFAASWLVVALALTRADRRDPRLTFLWGARVVTAAALAALVFGSVFWFNPLFNRVPVGEWPILNWLSFAYAMPALLFLLLAREIDDARDPLLKAVALIAAIALGFVFVTLQVRHLFQGGLLILGNVELPELSILVIAWLALSLGLVIAHQRLRRPQYLSGAVVIAGIAAAAVGFGSLLALNPLFSRQPVGSWPILNWLIPAYGVPSLLLLAIAQYIRQTPRPWLETPLQLVGGLLGFVFISLETRHLFHGDALRLPGVSFDELSCLIIVWLLLGWGALRLQRRQPGAALDIGAYALMGVAAVALVFGPLFLMNPLFASQSVGSWPILNSLISAYAIPALLLLAMARDVRQQPQAWLETPLQLFAGLLAFVFLSLETRHLFHGDALRLPGLPFGEWASLVILWLAAAWCLLQLRRRYPVAALQVGARAMIVVAGIAALLGSLLAMNPLLGAQHVGTWPLLNWLIAAYALPAALLALLAEAVARPEHRWPALPWLHTALGILALVMGFAFISLETRQWFQGPYLNRSMIGDAENYAYSAVWLLYGVALLAAGILRGGRALRYASMVTIMLTITKVFVLDTWGLSDLYRVASFLGLGICLIGIGYAYHRYVFRQPEPVAAKAA